MKLKALTSALSVSDQIQPDDLKAVSDAGFRTIICNRPDGEDADQPMFAEIVAAARKEGIETKYLPVGSGGVTDSDASDFAKAMAELPKPVLAFCRSGARSTTLWSRTQVELAEHGL